MRPYTCAVTAVVFAGVHGAALAQADVAAFYKGKTVNVIAPSGAGGSVYQ